MSQDYLDKLIEKDKAGTQIQSIPLHDTELRGITIDDPITVEGNPINFSTKNEQNAIQTVVNLEPVQDLHGYSKPWVGGAGKNLLPMTVKGIKSFNTDGTWTGNSYLYRDVTWTILVDNDNNVIGIKTNGTSNGNSQLHIKQSIGLTSGDYIINGAISSNKRIFFYDGTTWYDDYGSGKSFTISSQTTQGAAIVITNGTTVSNEIFYPMIRKSTVTDSTYEPYTNICPILPHEEIKIGECGKNLLKINQLITTTINGLTMTPVYSNGKLDYLNFNGTLSVTTDFIIGGTFNAKQRFIFLAKGITYTFSRLYKNTSVQLLMRDGIENVITPNTDEYTFTLDKDTEIGSIFFRFSAAKYENIKIYPQLEVGSSATDYEPYTPSNNLQIPLPENIYGGTLNLETGELVVDMAYKILTSSDILNASPGSYTDSLGGKRITTAISNAKYIGSLTELSNIISNRLETVRADVIYNNNPPAFCISVNDANQITFRANGADTVAKAQTYVINNEVQVCYELATPYTIQLTPAQLKLFKDVNNLNSSDYTTLTVTYHSNSIATLAPATDTTDGLLSAIDKRALDRTEEIVEGNPIQFETESAQVAKSTIVNLEPIQDLHGYDKPWVGGSGKNLLPMTVDSIKSANTNGTWSGNVYTYRTVTFEILTDNDNNVIGLKINGKANDGGVVSVFYDNLPSNIAVGSSYILSWESILNAFQLISYDSNNTQTVVLNNKGTSTNETFTIPNDCVKLQVRIAFNTSVTYSNIIIKPMIRLSTVTDATFEPYTNIASISGRSEVDIQNYNKNMARLSDPILNADRNVYSVKFHAISLNEVHISSTGASGNAFMTDADPNTSFYLPKGTYTISSNMPRVSGGSRVYLTSPKKGGLGSLTQSWEGNSTIFTLTKDLSSVNIQMFVPTGMIIDKDIWVQVEKGSQVTPYEKHKESTSLQIQLGQTVYGGTLDVENGVLVVDRVLKTIDENTSCTIVTQDTGNNQFNYEGVLDGNKNRNIIDNRFEVENNISYWGNLPNKHIMTHPTVYGNFRVRFDEFDTLENWKTYLQSNPLQVVYELATPTTISLTPEQVKLLQGVNTITTNAGNITLTYRNGSVATLNDLESLYAKLKAYIDLLHSS